MNKSVTNDVKKLPFTNFNLACRGFRFLRKIWRCISFDIDKFLNCIVINPTSNIDVFGRLFESRHS